MKLVAPAFDAVFEATGRVGTPTSFQRVSGSQRWHGNDFDSALVFIGESDTHTTNHRLIGEEEFVQRDGGPWQMTRVGKRPGFGDVEMTYLGWVQRFGQTLHRIAIPSSGLQAAPTETSPDSRVPGKIDLFVTEAGDLIAMTSTYEGVGVVDGVEKAIHGEIEYLRVEGKRSSAVTPPHEWWTAFPYAMRGARLWYPSGWTPIEDSNGIGLESEIGFATFVRESNDNFWTSDSYANAYVIDMNLGDPDRGEVEIDGESGVALIWEEVQSDSRTGSLFTVLAARSGSVYTFEWFIEGNDVDTQAALVRTFLDLFRWM
jgi:hypothetical protein